MSLGEKVAQLLVVGFPLTRIERDSEAYRLIRERKVGNFILFTRNIESGRQLHGLCRELRTLTEDATGFAPLVAIDQEGGSVTRIRAGATFFPGAMACAAAALAQGSTDDIERIGLAMGEELAAMGIDIDLAPDADINCNKANPVIGVRSYGDDPQAVASRAAAFARGLSATGVLATAKHFPGHGDTNVDSHLGLPSLPHGMERLKRVELVPFAHLIDEGVPLVMTSHILFPALEDHGSHSELPSGLPATLSPPILTGLLRGQMGFEGAIITDCLEMKAIADHYPDAAVQALQAGADLLCISHTASVQEKAHDDIVAAVRSGRLSEERIDEALGRVLALKARAPKHPDSWEEAALSVGSSTHRTLAQTVSESGITVLKNVGAFPPAPGTVYVDVAPRIASLADEAPERRSVAAALANIVDISCVAVNPEPDAEDIERVRGAAFGHDVILGCYNALFDTAQRELAEALRKDARREGRHFSIVAMRLPYDIELFGDVDGALLVYEYTPPSLQSLASFLAGTVEAKGRAPVSLSI